MVQGNGWGEIDLRNLKDVLADIRNECISGISSVQLVKKGKYSEPQAFIKIIRNLNNIIAFVTEGEKILIKNEKEVWRE